jgi:hypothetical protein
MRLQTSSSRATARDAKLAQLDLFDAVVPQSGTSERLGGDRDVPKSDAPTMRRKQAPTRQRSRRRASPQVSRLLTVADMPSYSAEAVEEARQALRQLPASQLWFTYKDIQFFFGVSRATVARRLREGLVPGVRMSGCSVIEDAPVRRFDREQLKWLLLALRHRQRQTPAR